MDTGRQTVLEPITTSAQQAVIPLRAEGLQCDVLARRKGQGTRGK